MTRQLEKEIERFEKLGIWKRVGHSQWSAGTFIQPKKTGDVRVLTDFRKLNEYLQLVPPTTKNQRALTKAPRIQMGNSYWPKYGILPHTYGRVQSRSPGHSYALGLIPVPSPPNGNLKCAWYFPKYHDATPWWVEYVQIYMDDILITSKGTYYSDHS